MIALSARKIKMEFVYLKCVNKMLHCASFFCYVVRIDWDIFELGGGGDPSVLDANYPPTNCWPEGRGGGGRALEGGFREGRWGSRIDLI